MIPGLVKKSYGDYDRRLESQRELLICCGVRLLMEK